MTNKIFFPLLTIIYLVVYSACEEDHSKELILQCAPSTKYYGSFILNYFAQNPHSSEGRPPQSQESICWEDIYPYQVSSGGTGNCGEGYEMIENPYLGPAIIVSEFEDIADTPYINKRYLDVRTVFSCSDFSNQNDFYALFQEGSYGFASSYEDFGNFIIEFYDKGKIYSSRDIGNENSSIFLTDVKYISEEGIAYVEVALHFDALLQHDGDYIKIDNAKVKGRFYSMEPW